MAYDVTVNIHVPDDNRFDIDQVEADIRETLGYTHVFVKINHISIRETGF
jgi:hypothetical protein